MLNEHAITYKERLNVDDLDYIIRKANQLGKSGRSVLRVFEQDDDDGSHIFFEVTEMKAKRLSVV